MPERVNRNVLIEEVLGFRVAGELGIELEVEFESPNHPTPYGPWSVKTEDSLRNHGVEYYTARPIQCNRTKMEKIKLITDPLNCGQYRVIQNCPRTSLHVHVNVLKHTPLQMWTAAAAYWLLDEPLMKYCGEDQRAGNLFCLRAKDSEGVIETVLRDIRATVPFQHLHGDSIRYASQNLNAIKKFGSIEFRGMRGTTDPIIIDTWTTEMYNIVHKTKRYSSPADILDTYLRIGPKDFIRSILSDSFTEILYSYGSPEKSMKAAAGMLCEFCYAFDWNSWQDRVNEAAVRHGWIDRQTWRTRPGVEQERREIPTPQPPIPRAQRRMAAREIQATNPFPRDTTITFNDLVRREGLLWVNQVQADTITVGGMNDPDIPV